MLLKTKKKPRKQKWVQPIGDPFVDDEGEIPTGPKIEKVYNPRTMTWQNKDGTPVNKPKPKHRRKFDLMPFGKFKGIPIEEVPDWYLIWVLENLDDIGNGLFDDLRAELKERENEY